MTTSQSPAPVVEVYEADIIGYCAKNGGPVHWEKVEIVDCETLEKRLAERYARRQAEAKERRRQCRKRES